MSLLEETVNVLHTVEYHTSEFYDTGTNSLDGDDLESILHVLRMNITALLKAERGVSYE